MAQKRRWDEECCSRKKPRDSAALTINWFCQPDRDCDHDHDMEHEPQGCQGAQGPARQNEGPQGSIAGAQGPQGAAGPQGNGSGGGSGAIGPQGTQGPIGTGGITIMHHLALYAGNNIEQPPAPTNLGQGETISFPIAFVQEGFSTPDLGLSWSATVAGRYLISYCVPLAVIGNDARSDSDRLSFVLLRNGVQVPGSGASCDAATQRSALCKTLVVDGVLAGDAFSVQYNYDGLAPSLARTLVSDVRGVGPSFAVASLP